MAKTDNSACSAETNRYSQSTYTTRDGNGMKGSILRNKRNTEKEYPDLFLSLSRAGRCRGHCDRGQWRRQ